MAYKLKGGAAAWWDELQITRRRQDKPPVMTWRSMKQFLQGDSFHPISNKFFTINLNTANKVHGLSSRCDLSMTEDQQPTKYISGLKYPIQECVNLHDVLSVDEAHNKAMKIEKLLNRVSPFKSVAKKTSSITITQQDFTSGNRPQSCKATDAPTANPLTATALTTKGKDNPYTKLGVGKYYRCGEPGHKSNECPKRRQVNMADYEDKMK